MAVRIFEVRDGSMSGPVIAKVKLDPVWFKGWKLPTIIVDPKGNWMAYKYRDCYVTETGYNVSHSDIIPVEQKKCARCGSLYSTSTGLCNECATEMAAGH